MKEAAGEANLTVITIVLIAIVLAVGTIVVNSALKSMQKKNACTTINGTYNDGKCTFQNRNGVTIVSNVYSCSTAIGTYAGGRKGYYVAEYPATNERQKAAETFCK